MICKKRKKNPTKHHGTNKGGKSTIHPTTNAPYSGAKNNIDVLAQLPQVPKDVGTKDLHGLCSKSTVFERTK